jgi:hypothetical protein
MVGNAVLSRLSASFDGICFIIDGLDGVPAQEK